MNPVIPMDSGIFLYFRGFFVINHLKLECKIQSENASEKSENANRIANLAKRKIKIQVFVFPLSVPRAPPMRIILPLCRKMLPFPTNFYSIAVE
ncbi:MAG: hypothetical protein IJ418_02335 [Clostridia bacterium]|nr:hypothetical protein [Clostridia bacterium]